MSDPTKKSIVINKSFLSNSGAGSELRSDKNKSKKHNRQRIQDEIIKPNKLKQILLDKINAKRKAEFTMSSSLPPPPPSSSNNIKHKNGVDYGIDKEKESKIFSDEFKKSLNFLDKYMQTKQTEKSDKQHNRQHSKTLKKENSTSLNQDILKSLHSNSRSNTNNINNINNSSALNVNTQLYQKPLHGLHNIQRNVSPQRPVQPVGGVSFAIQPAPMQRQVATPVFPKIQLNIPKANTHMHAHAHTPKNEKITLALGKNVHANAIPLPGTTITDEGNLVYTELPPELMPMPMPMQTPFIVSEPAPMPMQSVTETFIPSFLETNEEVRVNSPTTSLSTSTPSFSPIKLTEDKPYGCLKGGKKPTFRLYNKTIKHTSTFPSSYSSSLSSQLQTTDSTNIYTERQSKLNDLKNKHKSGISSSSSLGNNRLENDEKGENGEKHENKIDNSTSSNHAIKIRKRLRKTITKRFKLGKQGNVVGVLIKNNDTRKKIQKEHGLLKNKNLSDVKKYLVEQKLIKIGSTAPPNIIRKIYEDSVLTGEVENVGKDVILHNFLEQNKSW